MAPPKVSNLYPTCDPRYMRGLTDPASQPPRDDQGMASWAQQQQQQSYGVCRDPQRGTFRIYPAFGSGSSPKGGLNPFAMPTTPPAANPLAVPQPPQLPSQPSAATEDWFDQQVKNPVAWGVLAGAVVLIGTTVALVRRRRSAKFLESEGKKIEAYFKREAERKQEAEERLAAEKAAITGAAKPEAAKPEAAAPEAPKSEPQPEPKPIVLPVPPLFSVPKADPAGEAAAKPKPVLPPVVSPPRRGPSSRPVPPPPRSILQPQVPADIDVDKTPLASGAMPNVTTGIAEVLESLVRLHNRELMNVPEYRMSLGEEGRMRILRAIAEGRFMEIGEVAINPLGRDRVRVRTGGPAGRTYDLAFDRKADPAAAEKMNVEYLNAVAQLRGMKAQNPEAWAQELIVRRGLYSENEWKWEVLTKFGYDHAKPLPAGDGPLPRKWVETFPITKREPEGGAVFDATRTRVLEATRDPEEATKTRFDEPTPLPQPAPKRGFFGRIFGGIADGFRGVGRFIANLFTRKPKPAALPAEKKQPPVRLKDVLPLVIVNDDERPTLIQEGDRKTIAIDKNELRIAISRAIQWHTMELTQEQREQLAPFISRTEQFLEQHQIGIDSPARTGLARWLVMKVEADPSLSTLGTVGDIPKETMEKLLAEAGIAMELPRGMPWKAEPSAPAATIPEIDPEVKQVIDDMRAAEPEAFKGIADADLQGIAEGIREMRAAGAFEGNLENGRIKPEALRMAVRMAQTRIRAEGRGAAETERRDKEAREAKGPAEIIKGKK